MFENSIKALEIQKEFGAGWVFSSTKNIISDFAEELKANNKISEMPKSAKKNSEDKKIVTNQIQKLAPTASDALNKSTLEWINKAKELANKAKNLEELKQIVSDFDGLSIKKSATNCVFAEGNPKAKIMFIGEAPGENEDIQARPFCGVSGRLLDEMIKHIGFTRAGDSEHNSFYITNSIFWRPPGNRKPTPEEISICRPFVEKHIALIQPKIIVLVGATATSSVINSKESISILRKQILEYNDNYNNKIIDCFAIFHPSYLLRQPSQKKNVWFDLLKIKNHLESKS